MGARRALFINPPTGNYIRDDRCQVPVENSTSVLRAPIDLAYMAAMVEQVGWEARIVDYPAEGLAWRDFELDLEVFQPDLLAVSTTTPTLPGDMRACELAKARNPTVLTIAKGAHVTTHDAETLSAFPQLDIAIRGECEELLAELLTTADRSTVLGISYREGERIQRNPDRPRLEDLDSLPWPARHLMNNRLYIRPDTGEPQTTIQTSRGCPARCIYCLVPTLSGFDTYLRSPTSIVAEMKHCVTRFGIRNFYFRADTFTLQKSWTLELCRLIQQARMDVEWVCNSRVDTMDPERAREMRKAGCWMVGFGVESGNQEILRHMKKGATLAQAERAIQACKDVGIKTYLFWVLGSPWETAETAQDTIDFARKLDGDFCEFHIAYPFPGTPLHEICTEEGLLGEEQLTGRNVKQAVARSYALTAADLKRIQTRALRSFYLRPSYLARTLRSIDSPVKLWNYARRGIQVLTHP